MAFLFPDEIAESIRSVGLVILPIAPIEWHGPHLTVGCDPLLAHAFARIIARELSCPYFPPLFVGTERERSPQTLKRLGFSGTEHIEGMDFPANSIGSAYLREETFALVIRDTLNVLLNKLKFTSVLIINGHGADNQRAVLDRLCAELNSAGRIRAMWAYPGFPRTALAGTIGHAASEETSMLAGTWPACVDLGRLPSTGPLKNVEHAIVDGETFDGQPTRDFSVREEKDPRMHTNAETGLLWMQTAVTETVEAIRQAGLIR